MELIRSPKSAPTYVVRIQYHPYGLEDSVQELCKIHVRQSQKKPMRFAISYESRGRDVPVGEFTWSEKSHIVHFGAEILRVVREWIVAK